MYSSTFIFAKKRYDDAFHRLDQMIAEMAKEIPGYLGEETWENAATGLISNVDYWDSLEALQQTSPTRPPRSQGQAGQRLAGYQVVVSEVIRTYGDGGLSGLPTVGILNRTE